jgi:hypothetical protein
MSAKERRISPRKDCAVPLRFRMLQAGMPVAPPEPNLTRGKPVVTVQRGILQGEAVNLSERGIFFRSPERLSVGAPIEIYFRLPRELTGRVAEEVRCSARVVHVEPPSNGDGRNGIGATVERYEPVTMIRNWHN